MASWATFSCWPWDTPKVIPPPQWTPSLTCEALLSLYLKRITRPLGSWGMYCII